MNRSAGRNRALVFISTKASLVEMNTSGREGDR
jgi:hypothetical protein